MKERSRHSNGILSISCKTSVDGTVQAVLQYTPMTIHTAGEALDESHVNPQEEGTGLSTSMGHGGGFAQPHLDGVLGMRWTVKTEIPNTRHSCRGPRGRDSSQGSMRVEI